MWAWCRRIGAALSLLVMTATWPAGAQTIDPVDGLMRWQVGSTDGLANRYVRQSSRSSICEFAVWDKDGFFAEAVFCETLSGWYWKQSYMNLELAMDEFGHLEDFMTRGPEPLRDINSNIGQVELYGFTLDDPGDTGLWQCLVFIKGFNREDRGYQQMLMAYLCDDTGEGLSEERLNDALAGLSIDTVFARFID